MASSSCLAIAFTRMPPAPSCRRLLGVTEAMRLGPLVVAPAKRPPNFSRIRRIMENRRTAPN